MRKILPIILGFSLLAGCDFGLGLDDPDASFFEEELTFARGERFQDESVVWTDDLHGVALAGDADGAVGMVGMICSVDTRSGSIQNDVDESDGDEVVVDGLAGSDSYLIGAIDGNSFTVAEFWDGGVEGAVRTEVEVEGNDIAFLVLTDHDRVTLQQTDAGQCRLARHFRGSVREIVLPGTCLGVDADASSGQVFVSTTSGTVGVGLELQVHQVGPPGDVVAWSESTGDVAIGTAGTGQIGVYAAGEQRWSAPIPTLVDAAFVAGGELAVGAEHALLLFSAEGALLETTETHGEVHALTASPQGSMLAIQGGNHGLLYMVRVTR